MILSGLLVSSVDVASPRSLSSAIWAQVRQRPRLSLRLEPRLRPKQRAKLRSNTRLEGRCLPARPQQSTRTQAAGGGRPQSTPCCQNLTARRRPQRCTAGASMLAECQHAAQIIASEMLSDLPSEPRLRLSTRTAAFHAAAGTLLSRKPLDATIDARLRCIT